MSIALLMGVSAWAQDPAAVSVYEDCGKHGKWAYVGEPRSAERTEMGILQRRCHHARRLWQLLRLGRDGNQNRLLVGDLHACQWC